eukprot:SAG11_NODE_4029_length_2098_cov_3.906953_1_plen_177_part_00
MPDDVNDAFASRLAVEVLPGLVDLHTLNMDSHGMTAAGVTAVAAALPPRMQSLHLGRWGSPDTVAAFGPEGCVAVARALRPSAGTLRYLNLFRCRIGDPGAIAIAELLQGGGQALEILGLHFNGIGDEGGRALLGVLPRLTKLRALYLIERNQLSEEVEAAVRAAVAVLPRLKKLK